MHEDDEDDEADHQLETWSMTTAVEGERTIKHTQVRTLPEDVRLKMTADAVASVARNTSLLEHLREDALRHPDPERPLDVWKQELDNAILIAEGADSVAAHAWEVVRQAGEIIARHIRPGVERTAALQGAANAKEKAKRRREHR